MIDVRQERRIAERRATVSNLARNYDKIAAAHRQTVNARIDHWMLRFNHARNTTHA